MYNQKIRGMERPPLVYLSELKKATSTIMRYDNDPDQEDRPLYSQKSYYCDIIDHPEPLKYAGFKPERDRLFTTDWYHRDGGANKIFRDERDRNRRLEKLLHLYMLENERLSKEIQSCKELSVG